MRSKINEWHVSLSAPESKRLAKKADMNKGPFEEVFQAVQDVSGGTNTRPPKKQNF